MGLDNFWLVPKTTEENLNKFNSEYEQTNYDGEEPDGVEFETAEKAILEIIRSIAEKGIEPIELEKVKNKAITSNLFAKTSVLNKAMALCYAERLGNIELINTEITALQSVTVEQITTICKTLAKGHAAVLNYQKS